MWSRWVQLLGRAEVRSTQYDLRNQGLAGDGPGGREAHAADLLDLVDELCLERVSLFGHSYGTQIAAQFAVSNPDRIAALVLCGPIIHPSGGARRAQIISSWYEAMRRGGAEALFDVVWPLNTSDAIATRVGPRGYRTLRKSFAHAFDAARLEANFSAAIADQTRPLDLEAISAPTLLVAGADDYIASSTAIRECAELIAQSEVVVIPGAGHVVFLDCPDYLAHLVAHFVKKHGCAGDMFSKGSARPATTANDEDREGNEGRR